MESVGKSNLEPAQEDDLIADLCALHKEIETYRGGRLIDVDQGLELMREERDQELGGLRWRK